MSKEDITGMPTSDQEAWLLENYKLYNNYHLAKYLKISAKKLSVWFRRLSINKRNGKQVVLTKEQRDYVRENYTNLSHEQIAVKLDVAVTTVQRYCNRVGLNKYKAKAPDPPKHVVVFSEPGKPGRPKADHTNISQEERVQRWIKEAVTPDPKTFVPVKCLKDWQMKFIIHNYENKTAQQMAEHLEVDVMSVRLFCQANAITPMPSKVRKSQKKAA